ncbi:MAG TPA: desulfoferrodoxin family protein [Lachnospiraceae bacterium]|nr:desulfoferrodoxin family protein [Lachnospiraceae bacterium]HPF29045.1 desulfoferrodoxin family protein [Lachnospiraceae bacterium]
MKKKEFYVCPVCGNIITAVGQGNYSCCGITLPEIEAENCDETHEIKVEIIEDEYVVTVNHPMTKTYYLSFVAYVTDCRVEIVKLYPEQDVCIRWKRKGHGLFYVYCNKHGMFQKRI